MPRPELVAKLKGGRVISVVMIQKEKIMRTNKLLTTLLLVLILGALSACTMENKVIKITKNAIQNNMVLAQNALSITMQQAFSDPNQQYEWKARETEEGNIYLVSLVKKGTNSGWRWQTNYRTKEVAYVNNNRFLCEKYGLFRKDTNGKFTIDNISTNKLYIPDKENDKNISNNVSPKDPFALFRNNKRKNYIPKEYINYSLKGSVKNNTNKTITNASLQANLYIVFNIEKTITIKNYGGLSDKITSNTPWKPGETRLFSFSANIDKIYENYKPEFTINDIQLSAEDPVGFSYNEIIEELDVPWSITKSETEATKS